MPLFCSTSSQELRRIHTIFSYIVALGQMRTMNRPAISCTCRGRIFFRGLPYDMAMSANGQPKADVAGGVSYRCLDGVSRLRTVYASYGTALFTFYRRNDRNCGAVTAIAAI